MVHFQETDNGDHGSTNLDDKNIFINSKRPLQVQKETLLHEIQHVAYDDCPLFKHQIKDADEMEESLIRFSNPRLFMYLRDNAWLREFLFG